MATQKKAQAKAQAPAPAPSTGKEWGDPEVIKSWGEVSERDLYNIMNGASAGKMQDLRGQTVTPTCVVIYGRVNNETGELSKTVFIRLEDGNTYRTPSSSFCETLEKVADKFFGDGDLTFGIEGKTSKNEGREYLIATA